MTVTPTIRIRSYVNLVFDAFIPPLLIDGIAFEAHGQNTLVRFDKTTGELKGFAFRDFGGMMVHPPTLEAAIGVRIDTLPDHCILANDVHDAHKRLYHTLIHSHLHRLIRVLGFHHNGRGWRLVKEALEVRIPRDSKLWDAWMTVHRRAILNKSLLRMKLAGVYRDVSSPNFLQLP